MSDITLAETSEDLEARFIRLAKRFYKDTLFCSMPMAHHPAMREIVSIGLPVLPLILREISHEGSGTDWLSAIREITGKPGPCIPESQRGRVQFLKSRYLEWARSEGYSVAAETKLNSLNCHSIL